MQAGVFENQQGKIVSGYQVERDWLGKWRPVQN